MTNTNFFSSARKPITFSFLFFWSFVLSSPFLSATRSPHFVPLSESSLSSGHLTHSILSFLLVPQSCPTLCNTWTVAHRASCPWDFTGKNTGVRSHFLLQGVFPTQGLNLSLLHGQADFFFFFSYCWATREAIVWSLNFSKYLGDYGLENYWRKRTENYFS